MEQIAICHLSVVPLRKEPSVKSEMVNQIIMGELVTILDENEKWYMVRLNHDDYEGWVDKKQIELLNKLPTENSMISEAVLNIGTDSQKRLIYIPAGSIMHNFKEESFDCGNQTIRLTSYKQNCYTGIEEVSKAFLKIPYLWGGRTLMGMDCSGFTQIVFRLHGHSIKRDAYQQAETGEVVAFVDECKSGDLAFFDNADGKITHVGIVLVETNHTFKIIHCSGEVRIDAFDHQGIYNETSGTYTHNLRLIKRVF